MVKQMGLFRSEHEFNHTCWRGRDEVTARSHRIQKKRPSPGEDPLWSGGGGTNHRCFQMVMEKEVADVKWHDVKQMWWRDGGTGQGRLRSLQSCMWSTDLKSKGHITPSCIVHPTCQHGWSFLIKVRGKLLACRISTSQTLKHVIACRHLHSTNTFSTSQAWEQLHRLFYNWHLW